MSGFTQIKARKNPRNRCNDVVPSACRNQLESRRYHQDTPAFYGAHVTKSDVHRRVATIYSTFNFPQSDHADSSPAKSSRPYGSTIVAPSSNKTVPRTVFLDASASKRGNQRGIRRSGASDARPRHREWTPKCPRPHTQIAHRIRPADLCR